jgi:hypothetical protein
MPALDIGGVLNPLSDTRIGLGDGRSAHHQQTEEVYFS